MFLHESDYDGDVFHAGFPELADLPLDQSFSPDLQEGLGRFPVNGYHAQAEAGGQNHSSLGTKGG